MITAIDPGLSGAIIAGAGLVPSFITAMPDTEVDVVEALRLVQDATTAYIEKLPMMVVLPGGKKVSSSSMAKLHRNAGILTGALMALGIRVVEVDPHKWQTYFKLGTRKDAGGYTAWKNKLKGEAQKRFPKIKVTHAISDALLIYEWARSTQTEA